MSQVFPFHGLRYDQTLVGAITEVIAPPYDIIDAAGQKQLRDRHPYNIIRMELGLDQPGDSATHNRYTRAAATLQSWITEGILKRDAIHITASFGVDVCSPLEQITANEFVQRADQFLLQAKSLGRNQVAHPARKPSREPTEISSEERAMLFVGRWPKM